MALPAFHPNADAYVAPDVMPAVPAAADYNAAHGREIKDLINYFNKNFKKYIKKIDILNNLYDRLTAYQNFHARANQLTADPPNGVGDAPTQQLVTDFNTNINNFNAHLDDYYNITNNADVAALETKLKDLNVAYHAHRFTVADDPNNIKDLISDIINGPMLNAGPPAQYNVAQSWNTIVNNTCAPKWHNVIQFVKNLNSDSSAIADAIRARKGIVGRYEGGFLGAGALAGLCPYISILVAVIIILLFVIIWLVIMIMDENDKP